MPAAPRPTVAVFDSGHLPRWQRPEALLVLMTISMAVAFDIWMALLNNFAVEAAKFDGSDMGWMQTIREIPGFLSFGVIYVILFLREQTLAYLSLLALAAGAAMTGFLPTFWGLAVATTISSLGFHYFEAVNQSLQLQWLSKARAPQMLGILRAVGAVVGFIVFSALIWWGFVANEGAEQALDYRWPYLSAGLISIALIVGMIIAFPRFEGPTIQRKGIVLKQRYWLYYALVFMGGARRQIFMVFAAFMLVEKFGYAVHEMATLLLVNHVATMIFAPIAGRMIARFGERVALTFEYVGLIGVFSGYALIYYFVTDPLVAAVLYVADHIFFAAAFAQKTYFQKIADPEDHAPTAAVAFTINHIAAVFLPASLGYLYLAHPAAVFWLGAGMACVSLVLARLVPRHPEPGNETIMVPPAAVPAE